jgi:hypothetical protein
MIFPYIFKVSNNLCLKVFLLLFEITVIFAIKIEKEDS